MVISKFSGQDKLPFTGAVLVTLLRAFPGPAAGRWCGLHSTAPAPKSSSLEGCGEGWRFSPYCICSHQLRLSLYMSFSTIVRLPTTE